MPSSDPIRSSAPATENVNRLDGLTVLRFAHAFETGGGVELHLRDLNQGLSLRNAFTTILVHLTKDGAPAGERVEPVGGSKFIKVALQATPSVGHVSSGEQERSAFLRKWVVYALNFALSSFAANRLFARTFLRGRRVPIRPNDAINAGPTTAELIQRHPRGPRRAAHQRGRGRIGGHRGSAQRQRANRRDPPFLQPSAR